MEGPTESSGCRTDERRLAALVDLLADDLVPVQTAAATALRATKAQPSLLRTLAEAIDDPIRRGRARVRLEALRLEDLERELEALAAAPEVDLEAGAFLLARFHYPDLDPRAYGAALDGMAEDLRERLARAPHEGASVLRRFLHEDRGFQGSKAYRDPENVFLNTVMDRRVGIPTSLACIYLLLGRRLGIPLEGVNLPFHFLVRWSDASGETYMDAFARGRFLSRSDCADFLKGAGIAARPELLARATDREVLERLVRCLIASFRASGATRSAARFERCLEVLGRAARP